MPHKLNTLYRPLTAKAYTANGHTFWMIPIPKGGFWKGSTSPKESRYPWEKERHWVELSSYELGQYPVTQALWRAVMGDNPSGFRGINRPVERITWEDAQRFIDRLNGLPSIAEQNRSDEKFFRLPRSIEWEYAACGARYNKEFLFDYAGSMHAPEVSWTKENACQETQPVGRKMPNAAGFYDMSGNVWEWCEDVWEENGYDHPPEQEVSKPEEHVLKGGTWYYPAYSSWTRFQYQAPASYYHTSIGFRCARS